MTGAHDVQRLAEAELNDAIRYYEHEQPGLGRAFLRGHALLHSDRDFDAFEDFLDLRVVRP